MLSENDAIIVEFSYWFVTGRAREFFHIRRLNSPYSLYYEEDNCQHCYRAQCCHCDRVIGIVGVGAHNNVCSLFAACVPGAVQCVYGMCARDCSVCSRYVCRELFSVFTACVQGVIQCVHGMCAGDCSVCLRHVCRGLFSVFMACVPGTV